MRIIAGLLLLLTLGTFAPLGLFRRAPIPPHPLVLFEPVPDAKPGQRIGGLVFIEGWSLASNDPRFGGLSAIHVDGREVTAVSDRGFAVRFALPELARVSPIDFHMLAEGPDAHRDSEALAVLGGQAWVAFENRNAVRLYALPGWEEEAASRPAALRSWPTTKGPEAMLRLPDGRFLLFAEGGGSGGTTPALLFASDPTKPQEPSALRYRAPRGYRITDSARLSDGRLLFLNRRYTPWGGWKAVLTVAPAPRLAAGEVLEGAELARFDSALFADNMEGLSVTRENGRDTVWVASDDNLSPLQRTLILKFAIAGP